MRQAVIYPDEDGYGVAQCPSLPGCVSQGETKHDAIVNVKDAIEQRITVLEENGRPAPTERFETLVVV